MKKKELDLNFFQHINLFCCKNNLKEKENLKRLLNMLEIN